MAKQFDLQLKVGLFVSIGVAMTMFSILLLGGADSVFRRTNTYVTHFSAVDGLIEGTKVVIGGVNVGAVSDIDFDPRTKSIRVEFKVDRKYGQWVRTDSEAEMLTQGVLGDKYISVTVGSAEAPIVESGGELTPRHAQDITQFLSKGDQLMGSLNSIAGSLDRMLKTFESGNRSEIFFSGMASTAKNLSQATSKLSSDLEGAPLKGAIRNLNSILEKINNGTGTLGALVNDPGLYYDARSLMGGANRNRIVRNLVRQTIKESEQGQAREAAGTKK